MFKENENSLSTQCFQKPDQIKGYPRIEMYRGTPSSGVKDRIMANNSTERQERTGFQFNPPERTNIFPC